MNRDDDSAPLPPHGTAPASKVKLEDELLPCRFCGEDARRATLSMFGARCRRCYEAWAAEGVAHPAYGYDTKAGREIRAGLRRDRPLWGDVA